MSTSNNDFPKKRKNLGVDGVMDSNSKYINLYTGGHETKETTPITNSNESSNKKYTGAFVTGTSPIWCHFAYVDIFADPYISKAQQNPVCKIRSHRRNEHCSFHQKNLCTQRS